MIKKRKSRRPRNRNERRTAPRPVLRRLMLPLTVVLVLLIGGFFAIMMAHHEDHLEETVARDIAAIPERLSQSLLSEAAGLDMTLAALTRSGQMPEALKERDRNRLLTVYEPLFRQIRQIHGVSHFYFMDPDRVCILRLHKPEQHGDVIDRFTAREAERTGRAAGGIELGRLGTFTLRVVHPVYADGERIGYVELGKEIEHILRALHSEPFIELAVTIHKEALGRRGWEAGMQMMGREPVWDRFSSEVLIYDSTGRFPEKIDPFVDRDTHLQGEPINGLQFMDRVWRVTFVPVHDVSEKEVGELVVMRDVTQIREGFFRTMILTLSAGLILIALLLKGLYGILRRTDTHIRNREAELKDARERLQTVLDGIPDVIALQQPDHTILSYNRAGYELMGRTPEEVNGKKCFELIGREYMCDICATTEAVASGSAVSIEKYVPELKIWVHATSIPIFDSDGNLSLVVERLLNITDRKQAAEKLKQQFNFLSTMMETVPNPIFYKDTEGRYLGCNRAFADFVGWGRKELIGKTVDDISPCELAAEYREKDLELLQKGGIQKYESRLLKANRQERSVIFRKAVFQNADGQPDGIVGSFIDITAIKEKEQELREANRQLESAIGRASEMAAQAETANRAKSEFLANMSHEIRTPINGVIGMTSLLLDTELDEEQRRYAEMVRLSGDTLLNLVTDILDFSKIEAGKLDLEIIDFDLRALLDDFAVMMAARAHEKDLELICAAAPDVPAFLRGDPGRLRQILINLTGNAVKFTDEGEIAVRVNLVSESEDAVMVRFSVRDTGIGIPAGKQHLLFSSFTQVDGSVTRKHGGTGLGLAISRQLAEMMGGETGLNSEAGQGAEFWFTARFEIQNDDGECHQATPENIREARILVVDDNATNRDVLVTRLKSWGVRAGEAADGPAALEMLRRALSHDPFDAAILDMQMPGMDGATLGQIIKTDTDLNIIRLVMMTSRGRRGDAKDMAEIGFDAYLTKPLKESDLFDSLAAVLADRKTPLENLPLVTRHSIREIRKGGFRILLAEDNFVNQQVALGILRNLGLCAESVSNGAEALEALQSAHYDLVLMDVQMPEMDGFEATRAIREGRAGEKAADVPIIALTAHAVKGDREKCVRAGMNDYLTKPVDPFALAEILDTWLARENGTRQAGSLRCAAKGTSAPVFDQSALMNRLMGNRTLARTVVEGFLSDIPVQIERLRNSIEAGDTAVTGRISHAIKGAAASVSAEAMKQVAAEMEKGVRGGDFKTVSKLLPGLQDEFNRLENAMKRMIHTEIEGGRT